MIVIDADTKSSRGMRFDEFSKSVADVNWLESIHPIRRLAADFEPKSKPILWLRLVALGELCSALTTVEGPAIGIESRNYASAKLLEASGDTFVVQNRQRYGVMLSELRDIMQASDVRSGSLAASN